MIIVLTSFESWCKEVPGRLTVGAEGAKAIIACTKTDDDKTDFILTEFILTIRGSVPCTLVPKERDFVPTMNWIVVRVHRYLLNGVWD